MIPNNDPVRLLNACVEGMDLSELYKTYTRVPKNLATPKQLFKIVAYAAMNGTYSSRKIEAACRQNINYMYLLEGKPAPDNATIARFISLHLAQCSKKLMAESTWLLRRNGLISSLRLYSLTEPRSRQTPISILLCGRKQYPKTRPACWQKSRNS